MKTAMKITEYIPNFVTSYDPPQKWEINSKEDFYENFPKNEKGECILGYGHILVLIPSGEWFPIGILDSSEDWETLRSWGIPTLSELLNDEI